MSVRQKNKKLTWILAGVTVGMFGFGFALVPLYNTFCNVLGINGKTAKTAQAVSTTVDDSRWVTMEFIAINSGGVQWKFSPSVQRIKLHPGEMKRLTFYAENYSDHQMVVQAIPSVSPGIAAKYLKKTECFCFTQQTLNSHEAAESK